MNKAIVLEPIRLDLTSLYSAYNVEYIYTESGRKHRDTEELYDNVYAWALVNFQPELDLFVIAGNFTSVVVALQAVRDAWPSNGIRLLAFDSFHRTYLEVNYGQSRSQTRR